MKEAGLGGMWKAWRVFDRNVKSLQWIRLALWCYKRKISIESQASDITLL